MATKKIKSRSAGKQTPSKKVIKLPNVVPELPPHANLFDQAMFAEKQGDNATAIKNYEKLLQEKKPNLEVYKRLMIIYRKSKEPKLELKIINEGIKAFEEFYKPVSAGKHKTIVSLSNKISQLTGLTDKKGKSLLDREPIASWKKRKASVIKKIKG